MMNRTATALRLVIAGLILTAVISTAADVASRVPLNPFNFFGFFTLQSNLLTAIVYIAATVSALRGTGQGRWLVIARAAVTTYMIIVGIVYALLLAPLGAAGGVPLPWANAVLHIVVPIYVVVDWLVFTDRAKLAFSHLWLVLLYPLIWSAVVLLRGATDGWVPYPFLDPATGYGSVLIYVALIAVLVLGFGSLVFWASQFPRNRTQEPAAPSASLTGQP
jgi:hypothetical protein